ncbi:MAG: hypothetical protein M1819_003811 [Sarea resinae]|nr:MAG: hypothetical protein M1819_003811 [Sarea resinae]
MGNDGGSIPTRRELVKEAARKRTTAQVKETEQEAQQHRWTTCPISQQPLSLPVVSDREGTLYNKDAVLEYLLPAPEHDAAAAAKKAELKKALKDRILSMSDVVEVKFVEDKQESGDKSSRGPRWVCPITGKTLGPGTKAAYIVPCGHAFSEAAIKEVARDLKCPQCELTYRPVDIIPILSTDPNDVEHLATRTKDLRDQSLTHSLKKKASVNKKRKKNAASATTATETIPSPAATDVLASDSAQTSTPQSTIPTQVAIPSTTGIKNASTASLTAKVLREEAESSKRRKLARNENLESLFTSSSALSTSESRKNADFMSRGYSIPSGARR